MKTYLFATALLLSACLPISDPDSTTIPIQSRVDGLSSRLARAEALGTRLQAQVTSLEQQLEKAEARQENRLDELSAALRAQTQALQQWHTSLAQIQRVIIDGQRASPLGLATKGLVPVQTLYGSFLVELKAYEKAESGYHLRLQIANGTPFEIKRFRLEGDFGRHRPLQDVEVSFEIRQAAVQSWEEGRKTFSESFQQTLSPERWSALTLNLPTSKLADLEFIRLWILVEEIELVNGLQGLKPENP